MPTHGEQNLACEKWGEEIIQDKENQDNERKKKLERKNILRKGDKRNQ